MEYTVSGTYSRTRLRYSSSCFSPFGKGMEWTGEERGVTCLVEVKVIKL